MDISKPLVKGWFSIEVLITFIEMTINKGWLLFQFEFESFYFEISSYAKVLGITDKITNLMRSITTIQVEPYRTILLLAILLVSNASSSSARPTQTLPVISNCCQHFPGVESLLSYEAQRQACLDRALHYIFDAEWKTAVDCLGLYREQFPYPLEQNNEALFLQAVSYMNLGDHAAAHSSFDEYIRLQDTCDQDKYEAIYFRAIMHFYLDQQTGLQSLQQVADDQLNPYYPYAHAIIRGSHNK